MGSDWKMWGYLIACLLVPAAWGVLSALIFQRLDRRRADAAEVAARRPPVDYSI